VTEGADTDPNKRRLTREEAVELLSRPRAGVFSSLSEGGWIHSVPVHFLYRENQVRVVAGAQDVKTRNARRTGQGTLCVEVTEAHTVGTIRRYVSVSGPVAVHGPPDASDQRAFDEKYSRDDYGDGLDEESFGPAVTIILSPDRWIAWADWD
jgi:hypothetical protein